MDLVFKDMVYRTAMEVVIGLLVTVTDRRTGQFRMGKPWRTGQSRAKTGFGVPDSVLDLDFSFHIRRHRGF